MKKTWRLFAPILALATLSGCSPSQDAPAVQQPPSTANEVRAISPEMFDAKKPQDLELALSDADIKAYSVIGGQLSLSLTEDTAIKLRDITASNLGKTLRITWRKHQLVRARMVTTITSGIIVAPSGQIAAPSPTQALLSDLRRSDLRETIGTEETD